MSPWCPPKCDNSVPDELFYASAISGYDCAYGVEVTQQELPHVFRVPVLGEWSEANQVYEQHRANSALSP